MYKEELDEYDRDFKVLWIMELSELTDQLGELSPPDVDFDQRLTLTRLLTLPLTLT